MTEKRFTVTLGKHMVLENIFIDLETEEKLTPNQVSKLLNELHKTNERLKEYNNKLIKQPLLFDVQTIPNTMEIIEVNNQLEKENEQLKKEVEMLRNGLKAYDEALPLYLDCEDIMHFNNSELFEFKMEQMDFYKKYPNRVHYK